MTEQEMAGEMRVLQMQMTRNLMESQEKINTSNEVEARARAQASVHICQREKSASNASTDAHNKLKHQATNMFRPTSLMRPDIEFTPEGQGEWTATYSGVVGRGPSPELACQDFDRVWLGKDDV